MPFSNVSGMQPTASGSSLFGASATTTSAPAVPIASAPTFGSAATTGGIFGGLPTQPSGTGAAAPAATGSFSFGPAKTTTTAPIAGIFGRPTAAGTTGPSGFPFGGSLATTTTATPAATGTTGGFSFGCRFRWN